MNTVIRERLAVLRAAMEREGVDHVLIPSADYHNSEYSGDFFKAREHFSGFTGSAGTLLVSKDCAGLWTDGRYFIQAEAELAGTGVTLFRMLDAGVPTIQEYLEANLKAGETLAFDGRTVTTPQGQAYAKIAEKNQAAIKLVDLTGEGWTDRPALACHPVTVLSDELCGKSVQDKLAQVREVMEKAGAEAHLLSKLDDQMWLFNVRGADVECNPVALCYTWIDKDNFLLFIQEGEVTEELKAHGDRCGFEIRDYNEVFAFAEGLGADRKVLYDPANTGYQLSSILETKCQTVSAPNPTELLKAIKNPTELANMEQVYLKDSAAVCHFIYWLKNTVGKEPLTEYTAAMHLDGLRATIDGYLDLSFPTIAGYKANAAMMHYEAEPETAAELFPEGMLLVDSGGQYLGGTTDVTRTIVLGPISDRIKRDYTAVACGMLQLSAAKFLYGCSGRNLDILARGPIWALDMDYKCGTGHGVGYILNVHEGPQGLRWRYLPSQTDAVLEPGMNITNEPGVYIENSHGVRVENVMVVADEVTNSDGRFLHFDTLTWVPIDLDGIDPERMEPFQKKLLNAYHAATFDKMRPFMESEEELAWLQDATRAI